MSTYDPKLSQEYLRVHHGPVNNSKSKQMYTFSKQPRFKNRDYQLCSKSFYEIPDTLSRRSTTMGSGEKTDFTKLFTPTPPPGAYNNFSSFDTSTFSKSQHTFGNGRVVPKVDIVPPPDRYNIQSTLSHVAYSMRHKLEPKIRSDAPGPGTYNVVDPMAPQRHKISKFLNAPFAVLDSRTSRESKYKDEVPGPQHYRQPASLSPSGRYTLSHYQSHAQPAFGKEVRMPFPKANAPGPGAYQVPGEFGFY